MKIRLACALLACAAALPTHATTVALAADGAWNEFTIDNQAAPGHATNWIDFTDGSALSFDFTVAAGTVGRLTVVDAGFAGDSFYLTNAGRVIGQTADVASGTTAGTVVFDFDQALAEPAYSHGVFTFAAGSYSVSGLLKQSVLDGDLPLNATNGAVRLEVSAVPEPSNAALLLAGLAALVGASIRRRKA